MDFHEEDNDIIRSRRLQMFFKIGVLKNFAIFTGKQSCRPKGLLHNVSSRKNFVKVIKMVKQNFNDNHKCFGAILSL